MTDLSPETVGKLRLVAGRTINDPEKTVLPALIWMTKGAGSLKVYGLAIGWWDWHITLLWSRRRALERGEAR